MEYKGIVNLPDGESMFTSSKGILGKSYIKGGGSTKGYYDASTMYSELVTAKRDQYTYEISDELKKILE